MPCPTLYHTPAPHAKALRRQCKNSPIFIDAIEPQPEFVAVLEDLGATHLADDFAAINHRPIYDAVIMNPPYKNKMDEAHLDLAWKCTRPGGRIVALVSTGSTEHIDDEFTGYIFEREIIPKKTFAETPIETCLYLIHKPLAA